MSSIGGLTDREMLFFFCRTYSIGQQPGKEYSVVVRKKKGVNEDFVSNFFAYIKI